VRAGGSKRFRALVGGLALIQPTAGFDLDRSLHLGLTEAHLLKPHTAPGGGCSGHLKLPAKLPRESLNEPQP